MKYDEEDDEELELEYDDIGRSKKKNLLVNQKGEAKGSSKR